MCDEYPAPFPDLAVTRPGCAMQDSPCSNAPRTNAPLKRLPAGLAEIDYREFARVSQQLTAAYAHIAAMGLPPRAVATAMLGATVNLYECFDLADELPTILRALADRLDHSACLS